MADLTMPREMKSVSLTIKSLGTDVNGLTTCRLCVGGHFWQVLGEAKAEKLARGVLDRFAASVGNVKDFICEAVRIRLVDYDNGFYGEMVFRERPARSRPGKNPFYRDGEG